MPAKMELDNAAAEVIRKALGLEGMFKDMKAAGIQGLFPKSSLLQCAPDDHIIEQGESSRDVYIVCEGTVSIAQTMGSAGASLADLGKGEVFGEMALLRDGVRVASAVAQGSCRVYRILYEDIQAVIVSHPVLKTLFDSLAKKRSE
ncbi:MAG: cyclic nucleotide-binding domain-containing protein [Elusimicrobiota bacterium]